MVSFMLLKPKTENKALNLQYFSEVGYLVQFIWSNGASYNIKY